MNYVSLANGTSVNLDHVAFVRKLKKGTENMVVFTFPNEKEITVRGQTLNKVISQLREKGVFLRQE